MPNFEDFQRLDGFERQGHLQTNMDCQQIEAKEEKIWLTDKAGHFSLAF